MQEGSGPWLAFVHELLGPIYQQDVQAMEGSVSTLTSPVISPVTTAHVDPLSSAVLPEVSAAAADPQGPVPAPRAPAASMVRPVVSLIIPTKNEASNIAWVLEN